VPAAACASAGSNSPSMASACCANGVPADWNSTSGLRSICPSATPVAKRAKAPQVMAIKRPRPWYGVYSTKLMRVDGRGMLVDLSDLQHSCSTPCHHRVTAWRAASALVRYAPKNSAARVDLSVGKLNFFSGSTVSLDPFNLPGSHFTLLRSDRDHSTRDCFLHT